METLRSALEHSGYKVLSAESGESALRISHNYSGRIDVLISDVVMGRVTGFEVAAAVSSAHPNAIVILMSGSPQYAFTQPAAAHCFLQKPFAHEQLLTAIARTSAVLQPLLTRKTGDRPKDRASRGEDDAAERCGTL